MDEQAGPGVFFNNNNNSVLAGGGKGPLPDGDAGEAARAQYSIPGILHFLQHEWARFEVERAQWEVERAELQVRNTTFNVYTTTYQWHYRGRALALSSNSRRVFVWLFWSQG